ncbi:hypothetical protein [Pseudochryseolinea flava]|nr:hypothetical protein [Pseudochryseolinea flava]
MAVDCKAGAVVISLPDSARYYLDGIDHWKNNMVGRKLSVSGELLFRSFDVSTGEIVQTIVGDSVPFILNPQWEIVK